MISKTLSLTTASFPAARATISRTSCSTAYRSRCAARASGSAVCTTCARATIRVSRRSPLPASSCAARQPFLHENKLYRQTGAALRGGFPPVNSKFRHKTEVFIIFHQNDQKHGMNFIIFNAIFRVARRGKYGIIYNMNNELLCTFGRCNYG